MPPCDQETIFRRTDKEKYLFFGNPCAKESLVHYLENTHLFEWTKSTPEAWAELNKNDKI